MAEGLFITRKDLVKFTSTNANIDSDKFIQFIKIAQDIHVQTYLGTDLFEKIRKDIQDGTLSGDYLTLVTDYIKPVLVHFAMVEALPFLGYSIANKGIYKQNSENADTATKEEIDFLIEKERKIAQFYAERLIDHMNYNASNKYPEYFSNANEGMFPENDANFQGWVL